MARAPRQFVKQVLWREFTDLDTDLRAYLHDMTQTLIREEVHRDTSDASEVPEALSSV